VDISRHDADLTLIGLDDPGAVWTNHPGGMLRTEGVLDLDHIVLRDAIGDDHHETDFGFDCLHNGISSGGGWHIDHGGITGSNFLSFLAVFEDRESAMRRASFFRRNTSNHFGMIFECLLGLEGALFASHPLAYNFSILVHPHISRC
jgi:hypothetical protein